MPSMAEALIVTVILALLATHIVRRKDDLIEVIFRCATLFDGSFRWKRRDPRTSSYNERDMNQTVFQALGLRHLTFQRPSDILIGIGLVTAFLAAILLTSSK
jgi:hypothetical protein